MKRIIKIKFISSLLLIALLADSCSSYKSADVQQHGSIQKKGNYLFSLKPLRPEQLVAMNYHNLSPAAKDSVMHEYDDFLCYTLEIAVEGFSGELADYEAAGTEGNHAQKENYYQFGMQNDLKLKDANGIGTPCAIYYFEHLNTVTASNRFVIGFKRNSGHYTALECNNPYLNCHVTFDFDKELALANEKK